jgi:hypothetical protein
LLQFLQASDHYLINISFTALGFLGDGGLMVPGGGIFAQLEDLSQKENHRHDNRQSVGYGGRIEDPHVTQELGTMSRATIKKACRERVRTRECIALPKAMK